MSVIVPSAETMTTRHWDIYLFIYLYFIIYFKEGCTLVLRGQRGTKVATTNQPPQRE